MSNEDSQSKKIASVYAELVGNRSRTELEDDTVAKKAASSLSAHGSEGIEYLTRKCKTADPRELKKILPVLRHLDHADLGEAMRTVVEERVLPLDVKVAYFETMADLGHSIDSAYLQQMQEAEELYHQLSNHLKAEDEGARERAMSISNELIQLPVKLKQSFLEELADEWGEEAMPFFVHLSGKDASIDPAIVDIISRFPGQSAARALTTLVGESSHKDTVKRAKRALYILKEKGVKLEKEASEQDAIVSREDDDGDEAWSTTFDSFGGRLLILATPALSRILVCRASVSDTEGLLRFSAGEMSRGQFRDFLKQLKEQVRNREVNSIIRIDPNRCRWLIQQAYQLALRQETLIPEMFKRYRYRIKPSDEYDPDAVFSQLQPTEEDQRWVSNHPNDLFDMPELSVWMLDREQLLPYARRYMQTAESNIVLDEKQRKGRMDDKVAEYAQEYFDEHRKERLAWRTRETAALVLKKGRTDDARRLMALVESLEGKNRFGVDSFLQALMLRSIIGTIQAFASEQQAAAQQRGGEEQQGMGEDDAGPLISTE